MATNKTLTVNPTIAGLFAGIASISGMEQEKDGTRLYLAESQDMTPLLSKLSETVGKTVNTSLVSSGEIQVYSYAGKRWILVNPIAKVGKKVGLSAPTESKPKGERKPIKLDRARWAFIQACVGKVEGMMPKTEEDHKALLEGKSTTVKIYPYDLIQETAKELGFDYGRCEQFNETVAVPSRFGNFYQYLAQAHAYYGGQMGTRTARKDTAVIDKGELALLRGQGASETRDDGSEATQDNDNEAGE